jgi:gluconate kinase
MAAFPATKRRQVFIAVHSTSHRERSSSGGIFVFETMKARQRFYLSMVFNGLSRNSIVCLSSKLILCLLRVPTTEKEIIMMQPNEIRQRFNEVENTIHHAAECCQSAKGVPMDLKDRVQQLDQKATQARQTIQQSQDQNQIVQCVDDLEQMGDRARDACEQAGNVDGELKTAVMQAHQELSNLKHQLH